MPEHRDPPSWHALSEIIPNQSSLIRVHKGTLVTASRTLTDNHAFIKESHYAVLPFDAFTLPHPKMIVPTFADRFFYFQRFPVCTREAENAFFRPALCTPPKDDTFEVALLGPRMVLDSQRQRNDTAMIAYEHAETVIVARILMRGDALPGVTF
jgi:hypothetical protein